MTPTFHGSRDQSIRHMPFSIGVPLEQNIYLQPFSRYSTTAHTQKHTPHLYSFLPCNAMYCIWQTDIL